MNKILFLLSMLFLVVMMFVDFKMGINCCPIPQFTDEQMQAICIEEGNLLICLKQLKFGGYNI